jgi:hypothetical protein
VGIDEEIVTDSFFDRDVACVRRFFRNRFRYESDDWPTFRQTLADLAEERAGRADPESGLDADLDDDEVFERSEKNVMARKGLVRLDEIVEASGFARNMWKDLEEVSQRRCARSRTMLIVSLYLST